MAAAGVKIDELVVNSLASAEAVINETEKELGVAVADFGAGTIDLALFLEGSPFHTRVLPVGGRTSPTTSRQSSRPRSRRRGAEDQRTGTADLRLVTEDEEISVSVLGEDAGRTVSRLEVCQVIEARMRETFELLRNEIRAAGVRQLPAGIILTGGASQLSGIAELGREVLEMPVRVAAPTGIGGLVDTLLNAGLQHRRRAAPVGRDDAGGRRADALRVGAGDGWARPDPRRSSEHLSVGCWTHAS